MFRSSLKDTRLVRQKRARDCRPVLKLATTAAEWFDAEKINRLPTLELRGK